MPADKNTPIQPRNDEVIDYSIRPAKSIERKMICEALARLSILKSIKQYHYVGFGSTYFVDFTLFHKTLGIQRLTSIEGNSDMEHRIRFNSPYSCIDIKMGLSTERLPEIEWETQKGILWLDYTSPLSGYMFGDMTTFFTRALSGSVFIISVNVEVKDEVSERTTSDRVKAKLKKDKDVLQRVTKELFNAELSKEDYYKAIRDIIIQEIEGILGKRNKLETDNSFSFQQLFNFFYHDGQAMLTIGGILYDQNDAAKVSDMAFNNLDFYRDSSDSFEISVPHLTNREIQALDKFLPSFHSDPDVRTKVLKTFENVVSVSAIEKYAKVYQYFPSYKEVAL